MILRTHLSTLKTISPTLKNLVLQQPCCLKTKAAVEKELITFQKEDKALNLEMKALTEKTLYLKTLNQKTNLPEFKSIINIQIAEKINTQKMAWNRICVAKNHITELKLLIGWLIIYRHHFQLLRPKKTIFNVELSWQP